MVLYATFIGFKNYADAPNKMKWDKARNDIGEKVDGIFLTEPDEIFKEHRLKFGSRYMLGFKSLDGLNIRNVRNLILVHKNPRCDIFRRYRDEFHIISGKYKGKKHYEIDANELMKYCLYLARNSTNEMTVANSLAILKKLQHNKSR